MDKQSIKGFIAVFVLVLTSYVLSSSGGKTGVTQSGCTCHGVLAAGTSAVELTSEPDIFSSNTYAPESTYKLTITVTGGPETEQGGFDLKASGGTLANPGENTKIQGGEATHSNKNSRTWTVDWHAPASDVASVTFYYAGNAVDGNGSTSGDDPTPVYAIDLAKNVAAVNEKNRAVSRDFQLFQNYPNPFNASTQIFYQTDASGKAKLTIFDLLGKEIYQSSQIHEQPGVYNFTWHGLDLKKNPVVSGIYIYQLRFNRALQTKRMILLK